MLHSYLTSPYLLLVLLRIELCDWTKVDVDLFKKKGHHHTLLFLLPLLKGGCSCSCQKCYNCQFCFFKLWDWCSGSWQSWTQLQRGLALEKVKRSVVVAFPPGSTINAAAREFCRKTFLVLAAPLSTPAST